VEPHLSELASDAASAGMRGATNLGVIDAAVSAAHEPEEELPRPAVVVL